MTILENFFCLSANTKWSKLVDREKLALPSSLFLPFLKNLLSDSQQGFYYLSTCHRVELYCFHSQPELILAKWCEVSESEASALRTFRGLSAFEHFSRVAAGLESEIVGENQIMAQVRQAFREGGEQGLLSPPLNHILQRGLKIARTVRGESRIGEGRENLAELALASLSDIFESLSGKSILVVGAGTMAILALEKLKGMKEIKITWINRSREKIEAHPYTRFCEIKDFSQLPDLALRHDVVVLATASQHPLLSLEALTKARSKQTTQSPRIRALLDLGLPRNAHPDVSNLGFIVRNVDDFRDVFEKQDVLQMERVAFAETILSREICQFSQDFEAGSLAPMKQEFLRCWKWIGSEIVLEKSPNSVYNMERFWAKLGHVFMTKANELGPFDGGQFLKGLCESLRNFEDGRTSMRPGESETSNVISLGRSLDLKGSRPPQLSPSQSTMKNPSKNTGETRGKTP